MPPVITVSPNDKNLLMKTDNKERMPIPGEINITPSWDNEVCWDFEKKYCEHLSDVFNYSSDCDSDEYCNYISEGGKCCEIPCDDITKKCRFPVDNPDLVLSFSPESDRGSTIVSTFGEHIMERVSQLPRK
ncbi:uncharacterized protein LOC134244965 [Saccostrea cucullata]|uniref:uncharacterized protein LOC134244965 n=1 Tax=Saccostrea cuccullata TaxID=36930 RepID=UPI002ED22DC8